MPSLFSLFVDLKANTADFVSGMSTASYAAKKAGRDIEDSFSRLGDVASLALKPFGEVGAVIGETLSKIGEYAGEASQQFAHLGGGMTAAAVGGGLVAGAMAAVGAAAIGVAVETAKSIDEMYHLAESSGVAVETLSELVFVGKQFDIEQETMAKGLQFMQAQMVKAATGGANTVSVFDRLGISVRNSNGTLRDASSIFTEVIAKLEQMQDRTAAVGFSRQIFGRQAGTELLRLDTEGIEHWSQVAEQAGIVVTDRMGEAAHQFETTLNTINASAKGATYQLEARLLPVLQEVADAFTKQTGDSSFIDKIATAVAGTLAVVDTLWAGLKQIWISGVFALEEIGTPITTLWIAAADAMTGHFSAAWDELKTGARATVDYYREAAQESGQIWADNAKFIQGAAPKRESPFDIAEDFFKRTAPPKNTGENLEPRTQLGIAPKDNIADLIAKLAEQSAAELTLAASIQQTVAATTLAKAAGEADVKIAEERNQLLDQEKTLRAELANAQAQQLPGDVAKYSSEIKSVQTYLAELDRDAPLIRKRYQEIAAAKLFASTGEDLSKQGARYDEQIASLNALVAAYKQGGSAIAAADVSKEIEAARQKVADLAETYARFAAENPFDFPALAVYAEALGNADAQLQQLSRDAEALKHSEIEAEIQKQTRSFQDQIPALAGLADAYLHGADAVREAQVRLKVAEFEGANPSASSDQIKEITALYQQQSNASYQATIAQEAAHYNLAQSYSDEIEKLNQIREALQGIGASTLAVDAAIDEAQTKSIRQWDEMATRVGSLGEKFTAFFNEVKEQGDNFGENVFNALSKSIDGISEQLAKLVVTGKANFLQLFQGIEEQIVKAGFQRLFAQIATPFTGGAPGAKPGAIGPGGTAGTFSGPLGIGGAIASAVGLGGHAPDGSSANPFYTVPVDAQGNLLSNLTKPGSSSIITSLFSGEKSRESGGPVTDFLSSVGADTGIPKIAAPGGSAGIGSEISQSFSSIFKSLEGTLGSLGKSFGSIFSGIGGLFGGFLAGGGDVSPGKAYVVGEKHPEFFVPRTAGQVAPSLKMQQGHTFNMGGVHVYGVKDADSFKRSEAQINARFHREAQLAFQRNG